MVPMHGFGFYVVPITFGAISLKVVSMSTNGQGDTLVRVLCCIMSACIASIFQLILCEVLQVGDPDIRVSFWRVQTAVLLFLVILITPLVQLWRLFSAKFPRARKLFLPAYLIYLGGTYYFSKQIPLVSGNSSSSISEDGQIQWYSLRQESLALVSFMGITTMAVLCGISSISAPYTTFFADKLQATELDVTRLQESLKSIEDMRKSKELQISRLRLDLNKNAGKHSQTGFISKLANMVSFRDDKQNEMHSLTSEHAALCKLHGEIDSDLTCVQKKLKDKAYYQTLRGKIHWLIMVFFSSYCIYRVFNTFLRLGWYVVKKNPTENVNGGPKDIVILFFAKCINSVLIDLGVDAWSRVIGVFTSGCVFAAALTGVLTTIYRIMRALNQVPSKSLLDPLLAVQVASIYVISLATSLRFNLPNYMAAPIMKAIASPLDMQIVQLWNDSMMGIACILMLTILFCVHKLNTDRVYDEEMTCTKLV